MLISWCPQHRGVMRLAFFDPPPKHFLDPCPRCKRDLVVQERGKYEKEELSLNNENWRHLINYPRVP